MAVPGPKELQRRAMREALAVPSVRAVKAKKLPTPPAPPAAKQEKTTVKTTKTKKTAAKRKPAAKAKNVKADVVKSPAKPKAKADAKTDDARPGSKLETIVGLLKRPGGCTTADVLKATGWPTVSMPQQARAAGLTLKKEKVEGVTRYSIAAK